MLSPLEVPGGRLRNRVVMGSMHTGLEDRPWLRDELVAYYAERAAGGVGLIVTGGYAPTLRGRLTPFGAQFSDPVTARRHQVVTDAVHEHGAQIALQLLHAGRYAYSPLAVSASASKSPITPFSARAMSSMSVRRTVSAFARSARLAHRAGYDGVEIMGSEGYLLNQFLAARTNRRTDQWGGDARGRMRFAVEVARAVRDAVGEDFLVLYRISLIDLVEGGQTWDEVVELAHLLQEAGVSVLNTGIGWHEARIPTIITQVPRGAWTGLTARLRAEVSVPVMASNRINAPQMAETLLADGSADLVSMARPLLADPDFVVKAAEGRAEEINTCIACNQACLDRIFVGKRASCLVNPRAGRETELVLTAAPRPRRVAVVGAGPAGLAAATATAERGHRVTLFEADEELGGQFRLAMRVPGKDDFAETLRYYRRRLEVLGVDVRLATRASAEDLAGFDDVVLATGVRPRVPQLRGVDHPSVVTYADVLAGRVVPGPRVAVVGAGGIGVDVSHFLTHVETDLAGWMARWGVADPAQHRGGLVPKDLPEPAREVWLLQRKETRIGAALGKTSGWAHRLNLRDAGVHQVTGVTYDRVDDEGLHVTVEGRPHVLAVDHVVLCAGQDSVRELVDALPRAHVIGGADVAAELDAERAIRQGTELAARL
ncbi:FAD-dependent oxidoreductase [Ornithinimicrobium sp. W1665]|uniref:FAD-dependent oxidoreductase n=1 Tax=Ornithinimicrobium sp. W1665 TaxID=3416666 RepID=UPI003CE85174